MTNNRSPFSLGEYAFQAVLRHTFSFKHNSKEDIAITLYLTNKLGESVFPFIHYIAQADPEKAEKLLEKNPELAAIACCTITTCSGHTYENVTAIQLAYLMDDIEMYHMIWSYITLLPIFFQEKSKDQLAKKIEEVEVQRMQFKPFDFNPIVHAITADHLLKSIGRPGEQTLEELAKLKAFFRPHTINVGKSFFKEHLQEGLRIHAKCADLHVNKIQQWNNYQFEFFLINVIGHIQTLSEECFKQECSQGLSEITYDKKSNLRKIELKNGINGSKLTYLGSEEADFLLGRDFLVDIYQGQATRGQPFGIWWLHLLEQHIRQKDQEWNHLIKCLTSSMPPSNKL